MPFWFGATLCSLGGEPRHPCNHRIISICATSVSAWESAIATFPADGVQAGKLVFFLDSDLDLSFSSFSRWLVLQLVFAV